MCFHSCNLNSYKARRLPGGFGSAIDTSDRDVAPNCVVGRYQLCIGVVIARVAGDRWDLCEPRKKLSGSVTVTFESRTTDPEATG